MASTLRRSALLCTALALVLVPPLCPAAELRTAVDGPRITAENDHYRLVIDAGRGGAIRSFVYKPCGDREWIYPGGGGLLEDMIWQQNHPGELQEHPYEFSIQRNTAETLVVALSRSFKGQPYPGLALTKTITLTAASAAIQVEIALANPTGQEMFPGLWIQNRMWPGGNPKAIPVATRASYMGLRTSIWEDGRLSGSEFIRRPAAPWSLIADRTSGTGLLVLADFNYVQQFYNCLSQNTMEVFYDRVLIPAGGSWKTAYSLVPLQDVPNCFYADRRLVATGSSSGDDISFTFRPVDGPVPAATVGVVVEKADKTAVLARREFALRGITLAQPATATVSAAGSGREPVIVTLTVDGGDGARPFEFMHYADRTFYSMQDSAITFRAVIPKKVKPELLVERPVELRRNAHPRILHAVGLWADFNRIPAMLKAIDPACEITETFFRSSVLGPELTWQPLLVDDLAGFDLVVMDNVGADSLGEAGEIALERYVRAGGRLLVCGGFFSLGNSRWHESVLAGIVPIAITGPFDLRQLPAFRPITGAGSTAALGLVRWFQAGAALRQGATVLAEADGQPQLVSWACGKGAVMLHLATPMGRPAAGEEPYWRSQAWFDFLRGRLALLLGR